MSSKLESFVARYQGVGNTDICRRFLRCTTFLVSVQDENLLMLFHVNERGAHHVDLALKLNMLAVMTVFAFVGAILLGAF
jgi:hypothetical protein